MKYQHFHIPFVNPSHFNKHVPLVTVSQRNCFDWTITVKEMQNLSNEILYFNRFLVS